MKAVAALTLAVLLAVPAWAQGDPLAPLPTPETPKPAPESPRTAPAPRAIATPQAAPVRPGPFTASEPVTLVAPPAAPVRPVVVPTSWRGIFDAIRAQQWASAEAGIAALGASPLSPIARAELYTARNSPRVELPAILALLREAPDLPQSDRLLRLAMARGALAADIPAIPAASRAVPLAAAPRRHRSPPVAGEPAADALRAALQPLIDTNSAADAEALYLQSAALLSYEARAEASQRVAWIYYVNGDDLNARRVAEAGLPGATGEWASQANWIAGLASWRQNDCEAASRHFKAVAFGRAEAELAAGGAYWAARAEQACRRPTAVAPLMKTAARSPESFYGLLARETLGMPTTLAPLTAVVPPHVERSANVQRAMRLLEIGDQALAEEHLRYQARLGRGADHAALIALAQRLNLTGAQYWLAHNGPVGAAVPAAARYPMPRLTPAEGWRIDPALAFAHARQESDFRPAVVSPAGAVGLMQVRPGTAGDLARARGAALGDLRVPAINVEYGQSFIELMRRHQNTQGQLFKVVAAYNAGPLPVSRWNYINDRGDPLLWVESLPYWETRYYVPAVLRNMWVYQGLEGAAQTSLKAVAQHHWPAFPATTTRIAER